MQPSETIQKLAFEGPLSAWQLMALGCALAALAGVLTWRDCKAGGSLKIFPFLFITRATALGVVLWMLAGASMLTLLRQERPKSVVLLIDSSGSMDTVDPPDGSGNSVAWNSRGFPTIAALDRIAGELRSGQSAVSQVRRLIRSDEGREQAQALWEHALDSLDSAASQLEKLSLDAESRVEIQRVAALLKSGAGPLREQRITARSRTQSTRQQLNDRLDEAEAFLSAGIRRIEAVSHTLAATHESSPDAIEQSRLSVQSRLARKDKVASWLEEGEKSWLKDLEERVRVQRYTFASRPTPIPSSDWPAALQIIEGANVTDLNAALDRAAQDAARESVEAVVLVTDGGHNATGNPRDTAAALRGVPLYVVPIGNSRMPRDVILHHAHAPRAVFKNDNIVIEAMVTAYDCEGETLQIELLSEGVVVETRTNVIESVIHDQRIAFQQKAADFGRRKLEVRVQPVKNEHSDQNNQAQMEVEVMEDVIRVLVADARPRWEFRYLVALFKRDKHVEFEQLLFDPGEPGVVPSFPTSLEAWLRYRVIIIGDVTASQLTRSQQEMLHTYVTEQGGNLILIGGEGGMPETFVGQPLGTMLPVTPTTAPGQGLSLSVTAEGSTSIATQLDEDPLASDRIWREMSSKLPIYLPAGARAKPTSHVLIAATLPGANVEPHAFLSWQYVGLGRVVYIAAPVTYQLRYRNGDQNHHRFWGQLLRWAIAREMTGGSRTVRIVTDKTSYELGDVVQIAVHLAGTDGLPVGGARFSMEARQSEGAIKSVELREDVESRGTYRATIEGLPLGQIQLRAAGATIDSLLAAENFRQPAQQMINVDPKGTSEQSSPICNLPLLRQIADASGGALVSPASIPHALAQQAAVPDVQQAVLNRRPIWNRWDLLWVFAGCLTLEWMARRYWRMI